jgi:hypothetical protein
MPQEDQLPGKIGALHLHPQLVLTVYYHIKLQVDLQADKSPIIVKGPFFPRVVNRRYRIRGTMRDTRVDLLKPRNLDLRKAKP